MKKEADSSHKKKGTPAKRTNNGDFTTYFREQGPILKTKYPFLTATQIKGRARELWKKLQPEDKAIYGASTPLKTPKAKTPQKRSVTKKKNVITNKQSPFLSPDENVSTSSQEVEFQGQGGGYAAGCAKTQKQPPVIVHDTEPANNRQSILKSNDRAENKNNVSFTSPSQWISKSMTDTDHDSSIMISLTQSTEELDTHEILQDNSVSEPTEMYEGARGDESSQDLGMGSDESDVEKSKQLELLYCSDTQPKKKRGRPKKISSQSNKIDRYYTKKDMIVKESSVSYENPVDDKGIDELPSEHEKEDDGVDNTKGEDAPFCFTSSQSNSENVDDNDSDHDKDMILAQLYMEKPKSRKKAQGKQKMPLKTYKKDKNKTKGKPRKSGTAASEEMEMEIDTELKESLGSPLFRLKKRQQSVLNMDNCFGFGDEEEETIVSVIPLKKIREMGDQDAMVVVMNQQEDHGTESNIELKSSQSEDLKEKETDTVVNDISEYDKKANDDELFKTPSLPQVSVKVLKGSGKRTRSQTPQLLSGKDKKKDLTTPLMPDTLVEQTFKQANVPPKKPKRIRNNQHQHKTTPDKKCARKSLDKAVLDEGLSQADSADENNNIDMPLSPYEKRKRGIHTPNNKIKLTPRPQKMKERQATGNARRSLRNSQSQSQESTVVKTEVEVKLTKGKKTAKNIFETESLEHYAAKVNRKTEKGKDVKDSKDCEPALDSDSSRTVAESPHTLSSLASSVECTSEGSSAACSQIWDQPNLVRAAATFQLATKYKELDAFDSIFDGEEDEEEENKVRCRKVKKEQEPSSALAEAMKAMRQIAECSPVITSDLASSPAALSSAALSPALSGISQFSDVSKPSIPKYQPSEKRPKVGHHVDYHPASEELPDSGKDTCGGDEEEEDNQGKEQIANTDIRPYMQQLQHNVERSLMDMFDEPPKQTRNLLSGPRRAVQEQSSSDLFEPSDMSQKDIFL